MPYRRRRRFTRKRKPSMMTKASRFIRKNGSTAVAAYRLASKVARMVNVEYKFVDASTTATAISTSGSFFVLDSISQGNAVSQRTGDSIKPEDLMVRFFIAQNATAVATQFRVIIFRGKAENNVAYVAGDLLEYTGSAISCISPKTHAEKYRTKFLYDQVHTLSINGTRCKTVEFNLKLQGHVNFVAGGTGVEDGGIYMFVVSSESVNTPVFSFISRLSYTDN